MKFKHVVCGGTFDHLHLGHKKLLNECVLRGEKVSVGITDRALTRHKAYIFSLQPYHVRAKNVSRFFPSVSLFKIHDVYGSTLSDSTIDAICVTKDTLKGAEMINRKRKELGMTALSIIIVPFVFDEGGEKISSERIRQGMINREGKRYNMPLFSREKLVLPESLRRGLRKPLGHTFSSFSTLSRQDIIKMRVEHAKRGSLYLCAVGDMVTFYLKKQKIGPFLSIVDGVTRRKALNSTVRKLIVEEEHYDAINEKGTIQRNACIGVQKLFEMGHKRAIKQLFIQGEEDLLTLVAILFAPLAAHVWYGQKGVGAVDVYVTEKMKEKVYNLVGKFKSAEIS